MTLAKLELTLEEARTLLSLAQTRHAELGRMMQNLEEGEGMDLQRHNALKVMRPQEEGLRDLVMKLEGAVRELQASKKASA